MAALKLRARAERTTTSCESSTTSVACTAVYVLGVTCRDLRNQAFEADLTAQLASLDPIQAATRARHIAALPSPAAAQPQCSARDANDADGELQALRAQKLAALQRRQRGAAAAAADGYGRLVDVKAEDAEVGAPWTPRWLFVHDRRRRQRRRGRAPPVCVESSRTQTEQRVVRQ